MRRIITGTCKYCYACYEDVLGHESECRCRPQEPTNYDWLWWCLGIIVVTFLYWYLSQS